LEQFSNGIISELKKSHPDKYLLEEYEFLKTLLADKPNHIRAVLSHIIRGQHKKVILVIDNVDQRDDQDQQRAFLIATEFSAQDGIPVFVSLRPETFYKSQRIGSLSAYHQIAYTISPPRIDEVLSKRLNFCLKLLRGELPLNRLQQIKLNLKNLNSFIMTILQSINENPALIAFLDNTSNGNVRFALVLVNTFIKSGHINTRQILEIFEKTNSYFIPLHAVQRAIIYGENAFYDPKTSPIVNVFDISSLDPKEHFLCWLIIDYLNKRSLASTEGGFVPLQEVYTDHQDLGFTDLQISYAIEKLHIGRSIEDNMHSNLKTPLSGIVMYRVTPYGAYLINHMTCTFVYSDAMIVDTPIMDDSILGMIKVGDLQIDERLENVKQFIKYLRSCAGAIESKKALIDGMLNRMEDDTVFAEQRAIRRRTELRS
jgi:hypothetical protein